jgi:hypothetical protein
MAPVMSPAEFSHQWFHKGRKAIKDCTGHKEAQYKTGQHNPPSVKNSHALFLTTPEL